VNRFQCIAVIASREAVRYTPAGIPMVNLSLQHESQQREAGNERLVALEITAIGAGDISARLSQAELGALYQFSGFLARKHRNSKSLVFHITDIEPYSLDTGA
jgi:primosomal replication protein N